MGRRLITAENTNRLLASLVLLDVTLALWGYLFPEAWFHLFHGVPYDDPQGFLRRCAGNWAMFAVLQGLALWKWSSRPIWLGIVAGVRFSDLLTDGSYLWFCTDITPLGRWLLLAAGPLNLACGIYFYLAYERGVAAR